MNWPRDSLTNKKQNLLGGWIHLLLDNKLPSKLSNLKQWTFIISYFLWVRDRSLFSSRYVKTGGSLILPPKLCVNFIISRHLAFAWFFSIINHALIFACRFQSTIDFFFFLLSLLYLLDMIVKLNFGTQRGLGENSPHSVFRNCTLRYFLKVQKIGRNDETNIT